MLRFNYCFRFKPLSSFITPQRKTHESQASNKLLRDSLIVLLNEQTIINNTVISGKKTQQDAVPTVPVFLPPFNTLEKAMKSQLVLPLDLALSFPLSPCTNADLDSYKKQLEHRLKNNNNSNSNSNNRNKPSGISSVVKSSLETIIQNFDYKKYSPESLFKGRVLVFDDSNNSNNHADSALLVSAWNNPLLEKTLRTDRKTFIYYNSFAKWFTHNNDMMMNNNNNRMISSSEKAFAEFLDTTRSASRSHCTALMLQKMESMVATSQMTHVGLCVKDKTYFAEKTKEVEKQKKNAVQTIQDEFARVLPNETSLTLNEVKNMGANEMGEGPLRRFIIGHPRDTSEIRRPLNLCHGWLATSLYLNHLAKMKHNNNNTDSNNSSNNNEVLIPGSNTEIISYSLNYFGSRGLSASSEKEDVNQYKPTDHEKIKAEIKERQKKESSNTIEDSVDLFPETGERQLLRRKLLGEDAVSKEDAKFVEKYFSNNKGLPILMNTSVLTKDLIPEYFLRKKEVNNNNVDEDEDNDALDDDDDEDGGASPNLHHQSSMFHDHCIKLDKAKFVGSTLCSAANKKNKNEKNSIINQLDFFDCLLFVRLVVPTAAAEAVKVEVLACNNNSNNNNNNSNGNNSKTSSSIDDQQSVVFELHQVEAFRNFILQQQQQQQQNPSSSKKKKKNNILICMSEGSIAQDVLRLSLLQPLLGGTSDESFDELDCCIVDYSSIIGNLERMKRNVLPAMNLPDVSIINSNKMENTNDTKTTASASTSSKPTERTNDDDNDYLVFDDADDTANEEVTHKSNLFVEDLKQRNSETDDSNNNNNNNNNKANENSNNGSSQMSSPQQHQHKILTVEAMKSAFVDDFLPRFRNFLYSSSPCEEQSASFNSISYLILLAAGNALTSAPHFDPFVTCCDLTLQHPQQKRDVFVDHLPVTSEFRSNLLTAFHTDTPVGEALTRANSPIAIGCRQLDELSQVASDFKIITKALVPPPTNNAHTVNGKTTPPNSAKNSSTTDDENKVELEQFQFIHSKIGHSNSVTGRLSATQPNIFAISKHPLVRGAFTSRFRGNGIMMEADYSQMEVIVLCALTGDGQMLADLKNKINFHNKRVTFLKPSLSYDEVVHRLKAGDQEIAELRRIAKIFTFQRQYGAGAAAISHSTGLDIRSVHALMREEANAYPGVERYFSGIARILQRKKLSGGGTSGNHRSSSSSSSSVNLYDFQLPSGTVLSFEESDASTGRPTPRIRNYPVQGLAADLMQVSLAELWRRLRSTPEKALIVNVVHDSVWLDVNEAYLKEVAMIVKGTMENVGMHTKLNVGLDLNENEFKVDLQVGKTLAEMKNYYQ